MKTATSLLMALMVFTVEAALSQGDVPEFCICVADNSCTEVDCVNQQSLGCVTDEFTAPCGGTFRIRAVLSCPDQESCNKCTPCVTLIRSEDGGVVGFVHLRCDESDCLEDIWTSNLVAGKVYKLIVCLNPCQSDYDCQVCDDCVARGYVYKTNFDQDCEGIAPCNP